MSQWISTTKGFWLIAGCLIIGLLVVFPPFRLVNLEEERNKPDVTIINPQELAQRFWQSELPASLNSASDAQEVLGAISSDPQKAKVRYARVIGLDGPCHYYLKGAGTITATGARQIEVSLDGNDAKPEILLTTSMIFGNEVLDTTNIVKRSQFQKTNDYNAVSAEVNKLVESQVTGPFLQQAKTGNRIKFWGCSTGIKDEDSNLIPLRLVPVKLEIEQ